MMNQAGIAPFTTRYSPQIPELLKSLQATIAITTYQAGKLIFLSAPDNEKLLQLPRNFQKPMGLAVSENADKLALACRDEIIQFSNSEDLALHYPKSPGKYDALYMPRITYHTAGLDIHDLSFGENEELYAVNTLFSCLVKIDGNYNFTPYWQPPFIDKLVSEDRCHLNGMAMQHGKPKYVSAFNRGNSAQSWRENITESGVIMDVESNEVIAEGLAMPHSPRIFHNQLYVLLSATGELVQIDLQNGKKEVISRIGGFVRGMHLYKDHLFIGLSKLRKNSSTFAHLNIPENENRSGIAIIHLPTGAKVGEITYQTSVDEIYDVHILNKRRPNVLNTLTDDHKSGVMIPGSTYWARFNQKTNN